MGIKVNYEGTGIASVGLGIEFNNSSIAWTDKNARFGPIYRLGRG